MALLAVALLDAAPIEDPFDKNEEQAVAARVLELEEVDQTHSAKLEEMEKALRDMRNDIPYSVMWCTLV